MLGDTGNSCWKEPARDEPCSCSISCGRINSVCRITWSCWIACRNTVVLVGMWKHHCILYSKIDWRISPWIFSLLFFGNNSVHRIIVLVWMTGCMLEACGFDHMFSLLKRCKYSLYSDTMLHFGSQTLVELHAKWNKRRCTYVHLKNLF